MSIRTNMRSTTPFCDQMQRIIRKTNNNSDILSQQVFNYTLAIISIILLLSLISITTFSSLLYIHRYEENEKMITTNLTGSKWFPLLSSSSQVKQNTFILKNEKEESLSTTVSTTTYASAATKLIKTRRLPADTKKSKEEKKKSKEEDDDKNDDEDTDDVNDDEFYNNETSCNETFCDCIAYSFNCTMNKTRPVPVVSFYAMGDAPYSTGQAMKVRTFMSTLLSPTADFMVHVGDIRKTDANNSLCKQSDYQNVSSILQLSPIPVFIILGDNDWNDCSNPDSALSYWNEEFLNFETRYWDHSFHIIRQQDRPSHFAFVHGHTLFIGLNLVGGNILNETAWNKRLNDNLQWTITLINNHTSFMHNYTSVVNAERNNDNNTSDDKYANRVVIFGHCEPKEHHNPFFVPLSNYIQYELKNKIPIIYIHGDRHTWLHTPNFMNQSSFLRISLVGLALEGPMKVNIFSNNDMNQTDDDINSGFQIQRQKRKTITTKDRSDSPSSIDDRSDSPSSIYDRSPSPSSIKNTSPSPSMYI